MRTSCACLRVRESKGIARTAEQSVARPFQDSLRMEILRGDAGAVVPLRLQVHVTGAAGVMRGMGREWRVDRALSAGSGTHVASYQDTLHSRPF